MMIRRSRRSSHFTVLDNETIRDNQLSYRARGVLAELLSRPDDWETSADALSREAKQHRGNQGEGRDAMRAVFKELEKAGYLVRRHIRNEQGQFETTILIYDRPQKENPQVGTTTDYQASVDQASVSQASIRRTKTKNLNEIKTSCSPAAPDSGEPTLFGPPDPPKPEPAYDHMTDPNFKIFYEDAYPRKKARMDAYKAWKATLNQTTADDLIARARRFAADPMRKARGATMTPYPATWLRSGQWLDEPETFDPVAAGGHQAYRSNEDIRHDPEAWKPW